MIINWSQTYLIICSLFLCIPREKETPLYSSFETCVENYINNLCLKVSKHLTFVAKKLVYFAKHVQNLIRVCYIHLECFKFVARHRL